MFKVVLHQPEIAPNVGNIIRLCANAGAHLHLIEPLGFTLDDRRMRRAGLDYHEFVSMRVHRDWPAFLTAEHPNPDRIFALTTHGRRRFDKPDFRAGDVLLFGSESTGLPVELRESLPQEQRLRIPMLPEQRSLNISNAVALMVYVAWAQHDYAGSTPLTA